MVDSEVRSDEKRMEKWLFGSRLRELRNNRGMTQRELAAQLGISQSTVAHYEIESRDEPDANILLKLAAYFGVSSEYLLGRTNDHRRTSALPGDWEEVVRRAMASGFTPEEVERAMKIFRAIEKA